MNNVLLSPAAQLLHLSQRITVYPDLITEQSFWLQLYNIDRGIAMLYFYTLTGSLVCKAILTHKEHFSTHVIKLPASLRGGIYRLYICCGEAYYQKTLVIR
jgi:hypothetical protein